MRKEAILVFVTAFFYMSIKAQQEDSVTLFKQFVTVCNSYKQLPLQLEVDFRKTSNIPLYRDDSVHLNGIFHIQRNAAYIHFGQAEQVLTDSLALVVIEQNRQMILTRSNIDISAELNRLLKSPFTDSSVAAFLKQYRLAKRKMDAQNMILELNSRSTVYSTQIPAEQITVVYNSTNNDPLRIETIKRRLVKKAGGSNKNLIAITVPVPGKGDYLIKEDTASYVYKSIRHEKNIPNPVSIADRIIKDGMDSYVPVSAYKNYSLIFN